MIVYLGVFQIALAYLFVTSALRAIPALEASLILLIEPALNPLWAWVFQGERPGSVGAGWVERSILGATTVKAMAGCARGGTVLRGGGWEHDDADRDRCGSEDGAAPLWYLHLRRLATSCRALGVPIPPDLPTPEGGADRVHRLLVSRRGVVAGERPVGSTAPVRLVTSKLVHRPYPHKVVDRERFDRALPTPRRSVADDALLLTVGGQVAETAIWSVLWWEDGKLCAPPLELGVLPGVARARLRKWRARIEERRATPTNFRAASAFVANAVRGVVPVASLDGKDVPLSAQTEALAARFWP